LALDIIVGVHVRIEDHPLGGFHGESAGLGWVGLDTSLAKGQIESLGGSFLVEELVAKGLLLSRLVLIV
jgi:hypothetical protein